MHVDEFIQGPGNAYARLWFRIFRRPEVDKADRIHEEFKLFATYENERFRVTGCSRLGDVWLNSDLDANFGYTLRVNVADLKNFSQEA